MLVAGKDPLSENCLKVASLVEQRSGAIRTHVYSEANHAFDMREEDLAGTGLLRHEESIKEARRSVLGFMGDVVNLQK